MSTRTDWVDYAKAIGIILVVYGHVARGLQNAGIHMPEKLYLVSDSIVYSFHMPLFFFLSGLFFYHSFSKRGGVGLALNKIDTIIYPYLVWSILQGGFEVLLSNYTNGDLTLSDVLTLWEPRAQFWFLYALYFVFVASCIIYSLVSERYTIAILIASCVVYIYGKKISSISTISYLVYYFAYFIYGVAVTKYNITNILSSNSALLITMFAFISSQYLFHGYLGRLYNETGVASLLLACVSILFIVSLSIAISRTPIRSLAFIGESSLAIYLMHIIAGSGARIILSKIFGFNGVVTHLITGCLAGILLPLLALKMIKSMKIPYAFSAPISKWLELSYHKALQR